MCIISFGETNMAGVVRERYSLEFKQEAVLSKFNLWEAIRDPFNPSFLQQS